MSPFQSIRRSAAGLGIAVITAGYAASAHADSCEKMERMIPLRYLGAVFLLCASALIVTGYFLDPGAKLGVGAKGVTVSVRKAFLSHRDAAPHWYWITNIVLVVLSFLVIFCGFALERPVNCYTGSRVQGQYPSFIKDAPVVTYAAIHVLLAVMWMPGLLFIQDQFDRLLRSEATLGIIVTRSGLQVTIPPEILCNADELRSHLKQYREHPDYLQLCEIALQHSKQARSR